LVARRRYTSCAVAPGSCYGIEPRQAPVSQAERGCTRGATRGRGGAPIGPAPRWGTTALTRGSAWPLASAGRSIT
jgi:hypothetical protein